VFIPDIIGATGLETKDLRKNLEDTRKTFSTFTTKDIYSRNLTHNTGSTAVWNWPVGSRRKALWNGTKWWWWLWRRRWWWW